MNSLWTMLVKYARARARELKKKWAKNYIAYYVGFYLCVLIIIYDCLLSFISTINLLNAHLAYVWYDVFYNHIAVAVLTFLTFFCVIKEIVSCVVWPVATDFAAMCSGARGSTI